MVAEDWREDRVEHLRSLTLGDLPEWGRRHAFEMLDLITSPDEGFPCTFAVKGASRDSLRFGFVDELYDRTKWDGLARLLREYLAVYQTIGRETSLLVFFDTKETDDNLEGYFRTFWEILQYLHNDDDAPWPDAIPPSTADPMWEFTFDGTPMFVVCCTPAHVKRRSRESSTFLITFQPQWVFEHIGPQTHAGKAARRVIRKRLVKFDGGMAPAEVMGNYGDPDNLEWKQYFLPDTNDPDPGSPLQRCPFVHTRA